MSESLKTVIAGTTPETAGLILANQERTNARVHNFLNKGDLIYQPKNGGMQATIMGFGAGLKVGDYILRGNPGSGSGMSRYRITQLRYATDPSDQWFGEAVFDRRTVEQMDADDEHIARAERYWDI